jgi:hypothetical protein
VVAVIGSLKMDGGALQTYGEVSLSSGIIHKAGTQLSEDRASAS